MQAQLTLKAIAAPIELGRAAATRLRKALVSEQAVSYRREPVW